MKRTNRVVPRKNTYTAIFVKSGGWWAAYVAEIPGVNTQGRTLAEARVNVKDALKMVIEANLDIAARHAGTEALCEAVSV